MYRTCYLFCLLTVLLSGCVRSKIPQVRSSAPPESATAQVTSAKSYPARECPVTQPIKDEPPRDPNASPFGLRLWYVNADRTIWLSSMSWQTNKAEKVVWIRPQGAQLEVSGRRLDGDAPPLEVGIPCCYPTGFQVAGIRFPVGGCWEVTARAGKSELRFVTRVEPVSLFPTSDRR